MNNIDALTAKFQHHITKARNENHVLVKALLDYGTGFEQQGCPFRCRLARDANMRLARATKKKLDHAKAELSRLEDPKAGTW